MDASLPRGMGVTIAPLDAFALRRDLGQIVFEPMGNDQNYREVIQDQGGVKDFRFRYVLRAHSGGYDGASAFAWSRAVASDLAVAKGRPAERSAQTVAVDPRRAIATCLKPADDGAAGGCILRLRETAGRGGALEITTGDWRNARRTDLLERDLAKLRIAGGKARLDLPANGFAAVRLLR